MSSGRGVGKLSDVPATIGIMACVYTAVLFDTTLNALTLGQLLAGVM